MARRGYDPGPGHWHVAWYGTIQIAYDNYDPHGKYRYYANRLYADARLS